MVLPLHIALSKKISTRKVRKPVKPALKPVSFVIGAQVSDSGL